MTIVLHVIAKSAERVQEMITDIAAAEGLKITHSFDPVNINGSIYQTEGLGGCQDDSLDSEDMWSMIAMAEPV